MTELIITSSILILVVISLRHFLKGKISLRVQYALWALVLVRLLVPVSPLESPISIMNVIETAASVHEELAPGFTASPVSVPSAAQGDTKTSLVPDAAVQAGPANTTNVHRDIFDWTKLPGLIWYTGIGVVGLCLLLSNLIFGRRLVKTRTKYKADNYKLPVYEVGGLPSPCLFGVFRPAIYITPDVAGDETKLRHVLAHELTHYRHGDHIWSALRSFCLAIHWYNPLVWLAAIVSRRDAELACDESTIKSIGEANRMEYGRTLVGLTCEKRKAMDLLCCATTMTDGKSGIKERITLIAKKPKMLVPAFVTVLLIASIAVGCTFTGAKNEAEIVSLTAEEVESYNKTFEQILFDGQGNPSVNPLSHFLTSYYDRPEDINLDGFLRHFPSEEVTEEAEFEALKAAENWPFGPGVTLGDMPVPVHRIPAETVNEALGKHMDITLGDLSGVGMDELIYLKEYDTYYNFTSDFAAGFFICTSGETQGDVIRLYSENAELTLKKQDDGFLFASHRLTSGAPANDEEDEAVTALERAIVDFMGDGWWYAGMRAIGEYKTAAFETLREEEAGERVFYDVSLYRSYTFSDGGYTVSEDFLSPCVITLDPETLVCTNFWVPGDGAYFEMDIYAKFPGNIADNVALNSYQYHDKLADTCDEKARVYGEVDLSGCHMTITSNEKTVIPYENPLWEHTYGKNGWINRNGRSVSYSLPEISANLPSVTLREDYEISYADGIAVGSGLDVYDADFERIYSNADILYLTALPEGIYYVSVNVTKQGNYIEDGGDYESFGYECVFRYIVDDNSYDKLFMSRPVDDKVCVMLRLTQNYGAPGYVVPDGQEAWVSALEEAKHAVRGDETWQASETSLGPYIVWQDEYWLFADSGALINSAGGRVEAEDASKLYTLISPIMAKYGIGVFRPGMMGTPVSATLGYGESYTVTDAETLARLEALLSGATEVRGATSCPFDAILTLEFADGSTLRLAMATDSCAVYMVNGVYFDYNDGDNTEIFSLFGISAGQNDVWR